MPHTKFQSSEKSGSEEDFGYFSFYFYGSKPRNPLDGHLTNLAMDIKAVLYTEVQASEPNGSDEEDS